MIRSESEHIKDPKRTYIRWGLFYIVVILAAAFFLIQIANGMRTYNAPSGTVQLRIPYDKYLEGETITFAVTNNYNSSISVANNCPEEPLAVYKLVGNTWKRIHDKAKAKDCKAKSRFIEIPAGETVRSNFGAWPNLFDEPGKYRVAVFIEYFNSVSYQDFEVIKKPKIVKKKTTTSQHPAPSVVVPQLPSSTSSTSSTSNKSDDEEEQQVSTGGGSTSQIIGQKTVSTGAGSITVEYSSSYVYVLSISPAAGCSREGGRSGSFVEVTFKCGGNETQIQLWVSGGTLRQKIEQGD